MSQSSFGKEYLAIPGPTVIPDRILQRMMHASPNIYSGDLIDAVRSIIPDLKKMAKTNSNVAIYICNGHGGWEAALANQFKPNDEILVLSTGHFGKGWAYTAEQLGIVPTLIDGRHAPDLGVSKLLQALKDDSEHRFKSVLVTHVDTATSIRTDLKAISMAIKSANHPALLMVDAIASLGCEELWMDDWGVDVLVAASQKALMLPSGLSFVYFNDRARKRQQSMGGGITVLELGE